MNFSINNIAKYPNINNNRAGEQEFGSLCTRKDGEPNAIVVVEICTIYTTQGTFVFHTEPFMIECGVF